MFSPLIAATLLLTLIVTAYLYVKMCYSYWTRKGLPFLPPTFPFGNFGDSFLQKKSIPENVRSVYNSSDAPIVGVYMGLRPVAVIRDPKVIQNMLVKDSASFSHRGINVNENVDSMVASLFLQNGDKWKEMRRLLSPAFTTGRLKEMFETIVKCGDSLYEHVDRFAENGQPIEIAEVLACFTNNIIASVSFGIDIDCIKNPKSDFRKYAGRIFESNVTNGFRGIVSLASWTLTKMLRLRFVDKEVRTFMVDLVRQNMEYREQNNVIRKDIFQLMMQVRNTGQVQNEGDWNIKSTGGKAAMSLNEMAGQSFAFYSAGYVSSATTMSFCMYELAKNQHIQQKLYENISSALKLHDGKLTYDSLNEMKYLANCIEETLRMHPPFGFYSRQCTKDYQVADTNIVIEKGTTILLPVSGLQNDSKYYEQPDQFTPERYEEQSAANKSATDMPFIAFGEGPRICIGLRLAKMQTRLAICLLLQRYKFELSDDQKDSPLQLKASTVMRASRNGINLKVSLR